MSGEEGATLGDSPESIQLKFTLNRADAEQTFIKIGLGAAERSLGTKQAWGRLAWESVRAGLVAAGVLAVLGLQSTDPKLVAILAALLVFVGMARAKTSRAWRAAYVRQLKDAFQARPTEHSCGEYGMGVDANGITLRGPHMLAQYGWSFVRSAIPNELGLQITFMNGDAFHVPSRSFAAEGETRSLADRIERWLIAAGFSELDRAKQMVRAGGFRCPKCRYDLEGMSRMRCPECGSELTLADLEAQALEQAAIFA